jgi:acetylornithine deacetylase/succinyl-diaminopimelate desuccinylase-like protein
MNEYALKTGAQAVSYGPGDPSFSHTDEEFVEIDEFVSATKVISNAIGQFSYLYSKNSQI